MPVARSLTQPTGECLGERRAVGDGFPLTARPPQFRGEPPPLFGIDITRFEQPGYLIDRPSKVGGADRLGCGRQREASKRKRKKGTEHRPRSSFMSSPQDRRSTSSTPYSIVAHTASATPTYTAPERRPVAGNSSSQPH